jgi:AcrR family transcriptional regulator
MARTRLDRATVVEAARNLLDEEGLSAFSMTRLGDRLGVTAMALYRHVKDRAELEAAVVELVLDDLMLEDESGDAVAMWMRRVRAHWLEHPWLGMLLGTGTTLSRPWIEALEHLVGALTRAGLRGDDVAREVIRISRVTSGIVIQEIRAPLPTRGGLGNRLPQYQTALDEYGNDELFEDLVDETMARVARVARGARTP